jgi:hypothetical protein
MKTITNIFGVNYSTEQVELKFFDGVKTTLIHCIETPLDKDCECSGDVFDGMLDYDMFRSYHDSFVKIEKKIEKDL